MAAYQILKFDLEDNGDKVSISTASEARCHSPSELKEPLVRGFGFGNSQTTHLTGSQPVQLTEINIGTTYKND